MEEQQINTLTRVQCIVVPMTIFSHPPEQSFDPANLEIFPIPLNN